MAKRSAVFWVAIGVGGLCAVCSMGTVGLLALGVLADDGASSTTPSGRPATTTSAATGRIPTGHTPGLFPGMPGWLPSGRGVAIPDAELDDGPRGLWWAPQMNGANTTCRLKVFFADGRYADGLRPGGPFLEDLEGQAAENGSTGVGSFDVSGDTITVRHDGFTSTDPYGTGEDDSGAYFSIGQLKHRPLTAPSTDQVVGHWKGAGSDYRFGDDGTFESGQLAQGVLAGAGHRGTWVQEGHLLMLTPVGAPGWITTIAMTPDARFLIIGGTLLSRE